MTPLELVQGQQNLIMSSLNHDHTKPETQKRFAAIVEELTPTPGEWEQEMSDRHIECEQDGDGYGWE